MQHEIVIINSYLETGKVDAGIKLGAFLEYTAQGILIPHIDLVKNQPFLAFLIREAGDFGNPVQCHLAGIDKIVNNNDGILLGGIGKQTYDGVRANVATASGYEDARR